jgi:hypothetical protein
MFIYQALEAADVELGSNYPKPIISIQEVGDHRNPNPNRDVMHTAPLVRVVILGLSLSPD